MVMCTKQHLSNIWRSVHKKIKEHWGWVKKKALLKNNSLRRLLIGFSQIIVALLLLLSPVYLICDNTEQEGHFSMCFSICLIST